MIRIITADDHPLVRNGLKITLEQDPELVVVGEAATGADALDMIKSIPFDVLVLDISLPDINGLEVLRQAVTAKTGARILMLSAFSERQYALRSFRVGASGYVTKEGAANELVTAVRTVMQGNRYVSPGLADQLTSSVELGESGLLHEALSDREFQVFLLLGSGKSIHSIGQELSLSPPSVYTYRSRIYFKTGLNSVSEIVRYVQEHGLLRPK